jgi:hypothetical protein
VTDSLPNSTYTREQVIGLADEYENDILKPIDEAKATVSSLVRARTVFREKRIKSLGIPLDVFDEALAESKMSGSERQRRFEHKARLLSFFDKPLGFQSGMAFASAGDDPKAGLIARLKRIDGLGYEAGKTAANRYETNTFTPGSEEHARYDTAWLRGDEDRTKDQPGNPADKGKSRRRRAAGAEPAETPPAPGGDAAAPHDEARLTGFEDGKAGNRKREGDFPIGTIGNADYELGWVEGQRELAGA